MDNVQLYPSKVRVELNDKATKILFNLTPELLKNATTRNTVKSEVPFKFSMKTATLFYLLLTNMTALFWRSVFPNGTPATATLLFL